MPSPMPEPELRELAKANRSVNVDLASYYELRWHDPFFLSTWGRWNEARHAWARTWPYVGFKFIPNIYAPDPTIIPESTHASVAREYNESREAYLALIKHYQDAS